MFGNGEFKAEVSVLENGSYGMFVQDANGKYQMANIVVEGILGNLEIRNLEELNDFVASVNSGIAYEGKTVSLMEDIDLGLTTSTSWKPINGFKGTFDGNDHKIDNLYINTSGENQGFFGTIDEKSTIKELVIGSGEIRGNGKYIGAIAGKNSGKIENCQNKIPVTGSTYVGGVVGYSTGDISACINEGEVNGTGYFRISVNRIWESLDGEYTTRCSGVGGIVGITTRM